jgi:tRNA nucleotidyltransferase/poly(A) polymerase
MIRLNRNIFPSVEGIYIVGGSIRDELLGRKPADYDIACAKDTEKTARQIAANTNGALVKIGRPGQFIFRVVSGKNIFDVARINGRTIEEDLKQRDFTINAMAYSISGGNIIDCTGGLKDLEKRTIRMVSKDTFEKDPLRLLRAFRIGAAFNFEIEPATLKAIENNADLIVDSAGERIRVELLKLMDALKSYRYLSKMADTGLLFVIFPELGRLRGCEQNRHHIYDVFEHTMSSFCHLEMLINAADSLNITKSARKALLADKKKIALLKLAVLLHDIGKPASRTIDKKGGYHFYGHAAAGADMSKKICDRLKMSSREKCFIDFIIRNHLRPLFLFILHLEAKLTRKAVVRFFRKCHDYTPYILLHSIADFQAKGDESDDTFKDFIIDLVDEYLNVFKVLTKEPSLITGHDLINEFGIEPSPLFRKVLNYVEDARLSKEISDKASALRLAEEFILSGGVQYNG